MNARQLRQFTLTVLAFVGQYPSQLLGRISLQARLVAEYKASVGVCSVLNRIQMVCFGGIPSKIRQAVIGSYAVLVASLHTFGARANKCLQHKSVQQFDEVLFVPAQVDLNIAGVGLAGVEDTRWPFKSAMGRSMAFNSPQATNEATGESCYLAPFFGGKFFSRKAGGGCSSFRLSDRFPMRRVNVLSVGVAAETATAMQPVSVAAMLMKVHDRLYGLTSRTLFFLYSCVSHVVQVSILNDVVRPARKLQLSFGSFCILPQIT